MSKNLETKSALLGDAAVAQRNNGLIPTTRENEKLFGDTLERIDRAKSESKSKPKIKARTPREKAGEWELSRKPINDKKPIIERRTLSMMDKRIIIERRLLGKRMQDLRSKPEWKAKVESIAGLLLMAKNKADRLVAQCKLEELIERSNKVFGDWRKLPAQNLFFDGGSK